MQVRHRIGPGHGRRSNAIGIRGVAAASQISPEASMRGHRVYNSENRNYSPGGYGHGSGHPRQFQPPPHPPLETDIFVEAGRLAAVYLVSKGVLPPNALSGKWRNDGLKNQVGDFQGFRPHADMQIPLDSRESDHSRSENSALCVGPGRRRYSDEYNSMVLRNSVRGRRRNGSFRNYESEVSREFGRSGSWAERSMASPGMEADSDASACYHEELPVGKDSNGGRQALSPGEITQEGDSATPLEFGLEKCNSVDDEGAKANSRNEKYLTSDADGETIKGSDDATEFHVETIKEGRNGNHLEQKQEENKEVTASAKEDTLVSVDNVDLLMHCKFENVPAEARSEKDCINEDENNTQREFSEVSGSHVVDAVNDISAGNASSHQNHELKSLESDVLHAPAVEKELDVTYSTMPGQCSRSGSFPERSIQKEQEPDEQLSGFGRSNSMFNERGEKRVMDDDTDCMEGFKKLREWVPSMDVQSDGCLPLSSSVENRPTLHEQRTSQSSHATLSPKQRSLNISLFPEGHAESSKFMQEKQLFPGSFKTYDLNLCDVNENHDADSVLISPSVSETQKEVTPIDVDLSMSNNFNLPKRNGKNGVNGTEVEVIDLENDSAQEDQTFSNPERRGDTVFTDLDGFPNNVHNANEIPDVQDGYGLMISELLGNDSPNCSSVPTDLNSLHNDVGLPNGEGILGDDDSIYMSLGEIPISFLRGWEQPTQDYGKPF
ncbi:hypothetical protein Pfo_023023 [Paulownia fortunei]|nr:hypothetical protein Pfo_023023 [Paulownia fortunei]